MDRPIDFSRKRCMLCGHCGRKGAVDLEWVDRWEQVRESCPDCRVTCEAEAGPRVTVDPADPALLDENVALFFWYHTSTHSEWPARQFDPEAALSADARRMFEEQGLSVVSWAERQGAKALHVGTYEAAVYNMLRRISTEADRGKQFYLYRIQLASTITVRDGWIPDPGGLVGDIPLDKVCPPGVDVARYRNDHEDPGRISLALGRATISFTQQIAIPLVPGDESGWVSSALGELVNASLPRSVRARELVAQLAQRLPVNQQGQFVSATAFDEYLDAEAWAKYAVALMELFTAPEQVVAALRREPLRCL